jgi:hypothetical protein
MTDYYLAGTIEPSSGATFYAVGVAPGGCPYVIQEPKIGTFGVLTDAKAPGNEDLCIAASFDDLSPLTSGGGDAIACGATLGGPTFIYSDKCTGILFSAPDTFIYQGHFEATAHVPETCTLFAEGYVGWDNTYQCDGGSVVRTVQADGGCSWNGTELSCDCVPKYAPEPCESALGPRSSATSSLNPKPALLVLLGQVATVMLLIPILR